MIRNDMTPEEARQAIRRIVVLWIVLSAFGVLILQTWWFSVMFGVLSLAGAAAITYARHKAVQAGRRGELS